MTLAHKSESVKHSDSRGGGSAYQHRREKAWRKQGILFHGQPLKWEVFAALLEYQDYGCAVCNKNAAFEPLGADHVHGEKDEGELRGIACIHCNERVIGICEKFGHYRSAEVTAKALAYLANPPASRPKFLDMLRDRGLL